MNRRMLGKEKSLNDPIKDESGTEWQDWIVDDKVDQELKLSHKQEFDQRKKLMDAIDYTNIKYGRNSLSIAQAGLKKRWNIKKQYSSKIDTANFCHLPIVRAI